jgi:hypothetical protein
MLELKQKPQFNIQLPPRMLEEGYLVYFPTTWPSTYNNVRGQMFQVSVAKQIPYDIPYIIPGGDYRDVDFSNGGGTFQENLYPENDVTLEQIGVSFKEGDFLAEFFIPANTTYDYLEYAGMTPTLTDPKLIYLGAYRWQDSPYKDPQFFFYAIHKLTPLIMRLYAEKNVDFAHIMTGLIVNKMLLSPIPNPTQAQQTQAKVIHYYDELKW